MKRGIPLGLLLILAVVPAVVGAATAAQIEDRLRQKIVSRFGCQGLEVHVFPYSAQATCAGHFRAITIRADAASRWGLTLRPVYVKATDVTLDLAKLFAPACEVETKCVGSSEVHIELSEGELNKALGLKQGKVRDVHATLQSGQVTFTGTFQFLTGNRFRLVGKLQCTDGERINFVPTDAKINGVPVSVGALQPLLAKLNPLLDMGEMALAPRVKSITVGDGRVVVR